MSDFQATLSALSDLGASGPWGPAAVLAALWARQELAAVRASVAAVARDVEALAVRVAVAQSAADDARAAVRARIGAVQ